MDLAMGSARTGEEADGRLSQPAELSGRIRCCKWLMTSSISCYKADRAGRAGASVFRRDRPNVGKDPPIGRGRPGGVANGASRSCAGGPIRDLHPLVLEGRQV
jgi:hypothetical protein